MLLFLWAEFIGQRGCDVPAGTGKGRADVHDNGEVTMFAAVSSVGDVA